MAVTQYIGAAYVAHGWTTWDAQTSYDNMYVVEYQNGNYISKKNVPPGVSPAGNQGDNEYWAWFGVKSAQIEDYRQEVEKIAKTHTPHIGTINELNTLDLNLGDTFFTDGFNEPGDGGNGLYLITENIIPNNINSFQYKNYVALLIADEINVKQIGIKENQDCSEILNRLINSAKYGLTLYFPQGNYILTNITPLYKLSIRGDGIGKTIFQPPAESNNPMFTLNKNGCLFNISEVSANGLNRETTFIFVEENVGTQTNNNYLTNSHWEADEIKNSKICNIHDIYITMFNTAFDISRYTFFFRLTNIHIYDCNMGIRNISTDNFFNNIYIEQCWQYGVYESGSNNKWSNIKVIFCGKNSLNDFAFKVLGRRNLLVNCETQDNFNSGFQITGNGNFMLNCMSDRDGRGFESTTTEAYGFYITGGYNYLIGKVDNYAQTEGIYKQCVYNMSLFDNFIHIFYESIYEITKSNINSMKLNVTNQVYLDKNYVEIVGIKAYQTHIDSQVALITFEEIQTTDYSKIIIEANLFSNTINTKTLYGTFEDPTLTVEGSIYTIKLKVPNKLRFSIINVCGFSSYYIKTSDN